MDQPKPETPSRWVEVSFDCLPLRSVGRLDIPLDASPGYRARCEQIKAAIERHGCYNSYFLYNGLCKFHFTNEESVGAVAFRFEGTLLTNEADNASSRCELNTELNWETCHWMSEPIVNWLRETVDQAVLVEFNRFIAAGDLSKAKERLDAIQSAVEESGGYLGMYL